MQVVAVSSSSLISPANPWGHPSPAVLIAALILPLVIRVVNVIIEPLDVTILPAKPFCNPLRRIFHTVHVVINAVLNAVFGSIPVVVDILRNVLDALLLTACPSGGVLGCILDVFDPVVELPVSVALSTVLVFLEVVFVAVVVVI
jgi:hypothetical protein